MLDARTVCIAALLVSGGALAQEQPGDAAFCQRYAETAATAAEDGIRMNPACRNAGPGVHGDRRSHFNWCSRTPMSQVEGASVHIRRLVSQCSGMLVTPTEYGGYPIVGHGQFDQPYGTARQWQVSAAYSGRLFMYCVAWKESPGRSVGIGVDSAMPGGGGQWQLAVQMGSPNNWQGRLEIDGREPGNRAGADVSGSGDRDWTIAWLNMGQVDALAKGRQAVLGVGRRDFDFSLAGIAAAITKVQECYERRGVAPTAGAPAAGFSQMAQQPPAHSGFGGPPPASAPMGPEPAELVESIYRRAMAGDNVLNGRARAQFLSRRLVNLIQQDEQNSRKRGEPGRLDYDLLSGGQDMLKIGNLQVTEISRQQDRASVQVRFRNTAFGNPMPVETVTYELQEGAQGWRITNIIYNPQQNLLRTLQPQQAAQQPPLQPNRGPSVTQAPPSRVASTRYAAVGSWRVNAFRAGNRVVACEAYDTIMPNLRFEIDRENSYIDFKDGGQMGALGTQARIRLLFGPGSSPSEADVSFIAGRDGQKWARITESRAGGPGLLDDAFQNAPQVSFIGRNIILERPLDGSRKALDVFFRCMNEIR